MKLSDFDFELPEDLIATRPARPRGSSRLLVADAGSVTDARMGDLPGFLSPGDRLVLNDTRVIPARLRGVRRRAGSGGAASAAIDVTLLEPTGRGAWLALVKPLRKIRDGEAIEFGEGFEARLAGRADGAAELAFNLSGGDFDAALARFGAMPLPPYIAARRPADARDREDYQSVWAARPGAVAAPTASLHFDEALLGELSRRGVDSTRVTLHVGAGTFLPVRTEDVSEHRMHAEWGEIGAGAAAEINATRARGGRIVPVGTTALRLLETVAAAVAGEAGGTGGPVAPWAGRTDIFIRPGHRFRATDALVTNFHVPRSTLLMLVAALMGRERILEIYAHAVAEGYRFFSYGDSSLLIPGVQARHGQVVS